MNIVLAPVLFSVLLTGQAGGNPALGNGLGGSGMSGSSGLGGSTLDTPRYSAPAPDVAPMEPNGWGLEGAKGRLYFFGGTGFADIRNNGERHVVLLVKEDDSLVPDEEKYLYYREHTSGHRWSISKHATRGQYSVYFQPAQDPRTAPVNGRRPWQFYQSGNLIQDSRVQQNRSSIPEQGVAVDPGQMAPAIAGDVVTGPVTVERQIVQPQRCCGN